MSNIIVLPLIVPVITAILLVFLRQNIMIQRILSLCTLGFVIFISVVLLLEVQQQGVMRIDFSGWIPPFGILFVADSFAVLLVFVANIVAAICVVYAFFTIGEHYEKMYFYPFVLLMVAGVNGSFLTGDIFNLFVCFEVMLLASYALISLGGGKVQLREALKYVLINIVASWIFLVALAFLYGTIGTLNMAHISLRVMEAGADPLITTVGLVFLIVFSLKAGLLLFFWLPGSYSVPPTAIAALFAALLTKVGIYALVRTFTLLFTTNQGVTHTTLGIMAGLTILAGCMGALAGRDVRTIASYNVLIGVGFIVAGLAIGTESALQGVTYYLMHDMVVKAMLFLAVGMMIYVTGETLIDNMSGLIRNYPFFGWLFFIMMCSIAGIPPLSGFLGKVLIGQGAIEGGNFVLLGLGFFSSLIVLYSLLRIFLSSFFGETILSIEDETPLPKRMVLPLTLLSVCTIALGIGAESMAPYVKDAAETLHTPSIYIDAVLNGEKWQGEVNK
ncbi:Na+/H+ antiporter subunit D [Lysinibacillus sphaericus]|uniref:Monovalent cation/H+ antiporter subunit D n=1 Tax=Lysinibacillus sphaericus TaxID=1421 RepID=A0A2S0K601_LYSSH|nr:Na+/H+ antiporter subunit D [Lysinibacillus sphaericus]AVK98791.1 Na+/H+ antiporter subunit D [Lysinibacillus sphaericus]MED4543134.1 Na+/H+ antiporter subunit D [Lysinibacillus sphaericus]TKI17905.1 Na+/H+ antiporter subunit D [Lysinibacillus sphaericus]UDK95064.1 Na+/H+ antiporter subunit D [Lysinibacillus sphaericus]SUV15202.1 monovalent cation/H+ antiporter subunit D [Lysinibacillus sphaericus]